MTRRILRTWRLAEPGELIARVYQAAFKADVARLAPVVLAAATAGDEAAAAIVEREAAELARQAGVVAEVLRLGCGGAALPVALGGGLLTGASTYRRRVLAHMAVYRCKPVAVVKEPALVAARRAASGSPHVVLRVALRAADAAGR
jgi:N-acetylglucosamine kinase-like BadF-type ATPase